MHKGPESSTPPPPPAFADLVSYTLPPLVLTIEPFDPAREYVGLTDADLKERYIKEPWRLHSRDWHQGWTPLMWMIRKQKIDMVQWIVDKEPKTLLDKSTLDGTPLMSGAMLEDCTIQKILLTKLLAAFDISTIKKVWQAKSFAINENFCQYAARYSQKPDKGLQALIDLGNALIMEEPDVKLSEGAPDSVTLIPKKALEIRLTPHKNKVARRKR